MTRIPGSTLGAASLPRSPVTLADFAQIKAKDGDF